MSVIITDQANSIQFLHSDGEAIILDKDNINIRKGLFWVYITNNAGFEQNAEYEVIRLRYTEVTSPSLASNQELVDLILGYKASSGYVVGDVRITDGVGVSRVDHVSGSLVTVDFEHHEIHEGDLYRAIFNKDLSGSGTAIIGFTTPNSTKRMHMRPAADGAGEYRFQVVENPDTMSGGAAITPRNAERAVGDSSVATVVSDPTVTIGSGIVLSNQVHGTGRRSGGESGYEWEWILKPNTKYAFIVTNNIAQNNQVNIRLTWYEHVPTG